MTTRLSRTIARSAALLTVPLLTLAVAPATSNAATPAPRIVGGGAAPAASWGSIASVKAFHGTNVYSCGGTVIAPHWVVTAAHCTSDETDTIRFAASQFEVTTGRKRLSSGGGQVLRVAEVRRHPAYNPNTVRNDIALLRLSARTAAPPMAVARQSQVSAYSSYQGIANTAGWGDTSTGGQSSDDLLQTYLPLRDNGACAAALDPGFFDPKSMVCAGYSAPSTCQGDSGGPLVVFAGANRRPVLWGITSFGLPQGCTAGPSFFARVAAYTSFLAPALAELAAPPAPRPAPAPAPPSSAPGSGAPGDRTAPRLSRFRIPARIRLRGRHAARNVVIRLRASEKATVRVYLYRRSHKLRRNVRVHVRRGANRIVLPRKLWRVTPGSHTLRIRATDAAGNGRTYAATIRLQRGR
ncbi:MAG: S1 family peptidase [Solirubrobacteraceae bacterium]